MHVICGFKLAYREIKVSFHALLWFMSPSLSQCSELLCNKIFFEAQKIVLTGFWIYFSFSSKTVTFGWPNEHKYFGFFSYHRTSLITKTWSQQAALKLQWSFLPGVQPMKPPSLCFTNLPYFWKLQYKY